MEITLNMNISKIKLILETSGKNIRIIWNFLLEEGIFKLKNKLLILAIKTNKEKQLVSSVSLLTNY